MTKDISLQYSRPLLNNSYYYYFCLFYHGLYCCSFCASAGRKPSTWSISHSSQSFFSYTKHLSVDWRRSQHADLLNLCHSSCLWYFFDVFYHPLLYCTEFSYATFSVFLVLGLCTCFSFRFPSVRCFYLMKNSYESVCKWNSLNLILLLIMLLFLLLLLLLLLWFGALFWFQRNLNNIILIVYDFVVGGFSLNDNRERIVA